ncbi:MAG TPA: hypothetical protein VGO56_01505 [Pyrinomonadaceae bacterium]|jgi:hypothetical protein|nr:hypothetical protein [Pyrinomonadaceae bacterium]
MRKVLGIVIMSLAAMVCVSAQTTQDRTKYADDKVAASKLGIPAAAEAFLPGTSYNYSVDDFKPGVVKVGPRTTYLKEGLRTDEVIRLLGKPTSTSERTESDLVITIYEFKRAEGHFLVAEFVSDVLVRSWTELRDTPTTRADQ